MDIVERLRTPATPTIYSQDVVAMREAADEISRLRNLLQNGSPVVEGTIQHMAMRISELEAVIKSHNIPVKTMAGGVAHYCMGEK